jgi:hypothetical protein
MSEHIKHLRVSGDIHQDSLPTTDLLGHIRQVYTETLKAPSQVYEMTPGIERELTLTEKAELAIPNLWSVICDEVNPQTILAFVFKVETRDLADLF